MKKITKYTLTSLLLTVVLFNTAYPMDTTSLLKNYTPYAERTVNFMKDHSFFATSLLIGAVTAGTLYKMFNWFPKASRDTNEYSNPTTPLSNNNNIITSLPKTIAINPDCYQISNTRYLREGKSEDIADHYYINIFEDGKWNQDGELVEDGKFVEHINIPIEDTEILTFYRKKHQAYLDTLNAIKTLGTQNPFQTTFSKKDTISISIFIANKLYLPKTIFYHGNTDGNNSRQRSF